MHCIEIWPSQLREMATIQSLPNELTHLIIHHSINNLLSTIFTAPFNTACVEPLVRCYVTALLTAFPGTHDTVYSIYEDLAGAEIRTLSIRGTVEKHWFLREELNWGRSAKERWMIGRCMIRRQQMWHQHYHMWTLLDWIVEEVTVVAAGLDD